MTGKLDLQPLLRGSPGDGRRDMPGEDVVDHYVHAGRWEQLEYDRRGTDLERTRGFERA